MKNQIQIVDNFIMNERLRTNRMKLVAIEDFVQIYLDSGTERETGFRKRANIRLNTDQLKILKEWLNNVELNNDNTSQQ